MLIKHHYFYSILFFGIIINFAQSFDIRDNLIKLKDYNYNFNQNEHYTSFYSYPKSVKIENTTNPLLDPIIKLNSSESLKLSFDILDTENRSYAYTFIHCNSNWEYSNINQSDYLNGFFDNYIDNYQYSFNTISPYIHYECIFPNENINFKKSGNYVILVYDPENNIPIITKRFMVHEEILNIDMQVKKATLAKDLARKQEVDFIIEGHKKLNIKDPNNELKIVVQKNDDWNNIIDNFKPSFIQSNLLEYDHQDQISFFGGNEYRDFDIKSLRYYGKNVKSIRQENTQGGKMYNVVLKEDYIENSEEYRFKYDLNGKYVISVSENREKDIEGEYALVKFTLNLKKIENQNIYIYGELTNWDILPEAKMNYNKKDNYYYGFLYLKQGYYNYQYVTNLSNKGTHTLEGEYHETRNQYSIYVYYTPIWSDYHRLVGVAKSTSNALN